MADKVRFYEISTRCSTSITRLSAEVVWRTWVRILYFNDRDVRSMASGSRSLRDIGLDYRSEARLTDE
jgi:hypothetical protein